MTKKVNEVRDLFAGYEFIFDLENQYMLFYGLITEEEIRIANLRCIHA